MRVIIATLSLAVALPALAAPVAPTVPSLVVPAQVDQSYRINELEEQIRQLNGRIEELTFQILQTQENMRKQQEDNELRFQELEDRQGAVTNRKTTDLARAESGVTARLGKPEAEPSAPTAIAKTGPDPIGEKIVSERPVANTAPQSDAKADDLNRRDLEPRALGTLIFDKDGNVIDAKPADRATRVLDILNGPFRQGSEETLNASQFGATPTEVLNAARKALLERNYPRAEKAARAALVAWPESSVSGETKAALGEALFWQKRYYDAAEVQLQAHRSSPEAATAADNLLGLGLSLAGLNQREVACATYAEVLKQYPDSAPRLAPRIRDEQAAARCI